MEPQSHRVSFGVAFIVGLVTTALLAVFADGLSNSRGCGRTVEAVVVADPNGSSYLLSEDDINAMRLSAYGFDYNQLESRVPSGAVLVVLYRFSSNSGTVFRRRASTWWGISEVLIRTDQGIEQLWENGSPPSLDWDVVARLTDRLLSAHLSTKIPLSKLSGRLAGAVAAESNPSYKPYVLANWRPAMTRRSLARFVPAVITLLFCLFFGLAAGRLAYAVGTTARTPEKASGVCLSCGYDLVGLPQSVPCPECGNHAP
ncbi:MAG: hypothetical protein AAGI17_04390 [Planctomycetota bacterium]